MPYITSLGDVTTDKLYSSFNKAFRDYDRTWTRDEFEQLLCRRGYRPDLSFGAWDGGELVSFTLNCIDTFNGKLTAYDTGTGTVKEYRGQGLSSRIFNEAMPHLKKAGAQQYILEVLQHNKPAVSVYSKMGFTVCRELDYFVQEASHLNNISVPLPENVDLKKIDLAASIQLNDSWDFMPSWQNNNKSLSRAAGSFVVIGAFLNAQLVGYGIIEPSSGDIPQIAVVREYRRQHIGTALLQELTRCNNHNLIRVLNAPSDYSIMNSFLAYNGINKSGAQYEMMLDLQ